MSPVKVPWELAEFLRVPFWQVTCVEHSDNKMAKFYAFPPALRKQVLRSRTTWPPDHPALGISQRITRTEGAEDWQHFPTEPPRESDEEPDSKTRADASGDEPKCYERSRSPNKRFPMHPRHLLEWEETRFRLFFCHANPSKKATSKRGLLDANSLVSNQRWTSRTNCVNGNVVWKKWSENFAVGVPKPRCLGKPDDSLAMICLQDAKKPLWRS